MNIQKYINAAQKESLKGSVTDWCMGAVIVRGGKIIGKGHNKSSGKVEKFEKLLNTKLWSLHAEMAAILDCNDDINGSILFIAGRKINGNRVYCRPCKHCLKIIRQMSFKAVYYETKTDIEAIFFG